MGQTFLSVHFPRESLEQEDRQECLSYAGLKSSTQGLYLLNMPWYTLRAQQVEQVGRSLLETNLKSFIFGLHLNYQA